MRIEIHKYHLVWVSETDLRHREDGPAVEWSNGTKSWWVDGKRHREDGPAVEYSSGTKEWCINGKRHREGGPAIEWSDGTKSWYVNDGCLTEDEFNRQRNED